MKKLTRIILGLLLSTTPTWAQSEKVIIQFKSAPAARHFANRSLPGVSAIQPLYGTQKWVAAWIEEKKIWALLHSPEIELIEKDILYTAESTRDFTDSAAGSLSRQNELWGIQKTRAPDAWKSGITGSPEVVVAVIDTGINWNHPDLAPNLWTNLGESGTRANNGKDDDGNGLIDDIHGWDFVTKTGDSDDDWGHGSHCAGTIGAAGKNPLDGITGVNWKVSLMPVRWMKDGKGWGSDAISSIRYAVKMGARILNNSWGGIGYSKALEEAVREAEAAGVLFVVSAGNHGSNCPVRAGVTEKG